MRLNLRGSIKSGPKIGTGTSASGFLEYHSELAIFSLSTFLVNAISPFISACGVGGHPGIYTSTGMNLSMPETTEYPSLNGPQPEAQAPIATTYLGSGIWLYSRTICGTIFLVTVPETIRKSACLGLGRMTSMPNREMSNRLAASTIISMAQQARPNIIGHIEFFRDQA